MEDFYVYDENGKIMNYPENEELSFYDMNDKALHYGKEGIDYKIYYTKRGINVGS